MKMEEKKKNQAAKSSHFGAFVVDDDCNSHKPHKGSRDCEFLHML